MAASLTAFLAMGTLLPRLKASWCRMWQGETGAAMMTEMGLCATQFLSSSFEIPPLLTITPMCVFGCRHRFGGLSSRRALFTD